MMASETGTPLTAPPRDVFSKRITRAVIHRTEYGAIIEFSDGRRVTLWAFALEEPIMIAALKRVIRDGATLVSIDAEYSA